MIVTTSDDRSVRLWVPDNALDLPKYSLKYWQSVNIICKYNVYGHLARVMRCHITDDFIVSVGEDAAICYWDFKGKLVKKQISHQNGCIWAVDADKAHLVTGGGDGSVILHPLTVNAKSSNIVNLNNAVKRMVFTARGNVVILCDNDDLVYYQTNKNTNAVFWTLKSDSTYKLLSVSSCKQIISVVDMLGNFDIFVEDCKDDSINNVISTKLEIGKILSMHWADNRLLVLCCEDGHIVVLGANGTKPEMISKFVLPSCKERWLTAAAVNVNSKIFVFGDRCGNIHVYSENRVDPLKTIRKIHGRYGPTSITFQSDKVVTTGRDGTVKIISIVGNIKILHTIDINFQWIEKFIDKTKNIICGFQERVFVVYDLKNNCTILEVPCGGGHRPWDINRYFIKFDDIYEEFIKLVYLKNSKLHEETFQLSKIASKNIINGSHAKEINCLKIYNPTCGHDVTFMFSGSEDTALRISSMKSEKLKNEITFKHLSSVKCMKIVKLENNKVLLTSAGGRAQISIKLITFILDNDEVNVGSEDVINYLIKGTDKERKGDQTWRNCAVDFDPETRIMDIEVINMDKNIFYIFAGCSDSLLRVFKLNLDGNENSLDLVNTVRHHNTCILKTVGFKYKDKTLLVTTDTKGEVAIWDVFDGKQLKNDLKPSLVTHSNQSGINSVAVEILNDDHVMIATGGDDNAVYLLLLKHDENERLFEICDLLKLDKNHCSLVSGLCLFDKKYLLSVSIDQRLTLSRWELNGSRIENYFISQCYSEVSDVQGMDVIEKSL